MNCPTLKELPSPPPDKKGWPWTMDSPQLPNRRIDGSPWPKISIVTPSFNQAQFIEESIRSVLLQGYPELEYMIIDGGSTDGTVDIIKKYQKWMSYWVSEPDNGQSDAINKGFRIVRGDIIGWVNADDLYAFRAFQNITSIHIEQSRQIIIGQSREIDSTGRYMRLHSDVPYNRDQIIGFKILLPQPSIFFPRSFFNQIGYMDEDLDLCMDYEFFIKATSLQWFTYIPTVLSFMRVRPENKTSTHFLKMVEQILSVSKRYWGSPLSLKYWYFLFRSFRIRSWAHLKIADGALERDRKTVIKNLWLSFKNFPPSIFSRSSIAMLLRVLFGFHVVDSVNRFLINRQRDQIK